VRTSVGVPTRSTRCEDGATVEFFDNVIMEEEGGAKKTKWNSD